MCMKAYNPREWDCVLFLTGKFQFTGGIYLYEKNIFFAAGNFNALKFIRLRHIRFTRYGRCIRISIRHF